MESLLLARLGRHRSVVVAFSGGVDSSCLAFAAHRVLGAAARSVTALSPAVSSYQRELALRFASRHGLNHRFVETRELEDSNYASNPANRCYFCKSELYGLLLGLARRWGCDAVLDGSNLDDASDYRPGRAAARERGVKSPLLEAGLRKKDVRELSFKWGLETWDLPAMPCLSSRFPYGVPITERKLARVERCEAELRGLGFREFRVRHHEDLARIEVGVEELPRLLDRELFERVRAAFLSHGYVEVTLDPRGFRSGSLNEGLVADHLVDLRS